MNKTYLEFYSNLFLCFVTSYHKNGAISL